jgi:hypothetical protein
MLLYRRVTAAAVAGLIAFIVGHYAKAATSDFLYEPQSTSQLVQTPGATVSLALFLHATTTTGANLINNNGGLLSAGVAMQVASSIGTPSSIASYALNGTDFSSPSFLQPATITSDGSRMYNDSEATASTTSGVMFGNTAGGTIDNPAANNEIYLGTVTLTAGGPGSRTVFNIGENSTPSGQTGGFTITYLPPPSNGFAGYDIDEPSLNRPGSPAYIGVGTNVSTFTLNVAGTIPEPGTLGLLAVGALLGLCRHRRIA